MRNAVVVVFVMEGCPACEDFMPKVRAAAARHPGVTIHIADAAGNNPQVRQLADQYRVTVTPTTLVLRRPTGWIKAEGDTDIERLLQLAERA